jgi:hypothetical protein
MSLRISVASRNRPHLNAVYNYDNLKTAQIGRAQGVEGPHKVAVLLPHSVCSPMKIEIFLLIPDPNGDRKAGSDVGRSQVTGVLVLTSYSPYHNAVNTNPFVTERPRFNC